MVIMEEQEKARQHQAMLKEYDSLRKEIAARQSIRFTILGFTVASIGTILGLTTQSLSPGKTPFDHFTRTLVCFALGLLITAQILTIHLTQWIDSIATYIRTFIEPPVDGLEWETRLRQRRKRRRGGTSRALACYYAFLTLAVSAVAYVTSPSLSPNALAITLSLLLVSLACSADLFFHISRGWKTDWT
jgi:hypothetical protein